MIDARLHLVQSPCLSAVAIDLRPARNSRLYLVPDHVAFYKIAIYLVVRHCMRPGTDNAHAPLQYIDELRQFVQGILPQESPDAGYAGIIPLCLPDGIPIFADAHRAKLVNENFLAVQPIASLLENNGAWRIQADGSRDEQQKWRDE